MANKVALNNVDHHDLKVAVRYGAEQGDCVNQVALFPTEFEDAQREFPILFRKDGQGAFQAVALLGLERDENLFFQDGQWQSRHVPAAQQRGPFSVGVPAGGGEPMIHVDLDDPRVGAADGMPLFLPQGGNAPYLEHVARVLRAIYTGIELSAPMYAAFDELGLIQPVALELMLSDVERFNLPDHYTIAQDRLLALDAAVLERLNRAGYLYAAFLVVASFNNLGRLIEVKNAKRAAG